MLGLPRNVSVSRDEEISTRAWYARVRTATEGWESARNGAAKSPVETTHGTSRKPRERPVSTRPTKVSRFRPGIPAPIRRAPRSA